MSTGWSGSLLGRLEERDSKEGRKLARKQAFDVQTWPKKLVAPLPSSSLPSYAQNRKVVHTAAGQDKVPIQSVFGEGIPN